MKPVVFEPDAEAELYEAARWYEARKRGLGTGLLDEVDAANRAIEDQPRRFPAVAMSGRSGDAEVRRVVLQRFPYALVFVVLPKVIAVVAVAHTRREPGYWRDRVGAAVRARGR